MKVKIKGQVRSNVIGLGWGEWLVQQRHKKRCLVGIVGLKLMKLTMLRWCSEKARWFFDSRLNWRNLKHHVLSHQIKELFPGMERKHLSSPDPGDLFLRSNFLSTWHPFSHLFGCTWLWPSKATFWKLELWTQPVKAMGCGSTKNAMSVTWASAWVWWNWDEGVCWSEHELLGLLGDLILHRGWSILSKYLIRGVNYIHHFTMTKFQRTEKVSFAKIPTKGITPVYVLEGLGSLAVLWYIWCYWKLCTFKKLWNPCFRRLFIN